MLVAHAKKILSKISAEPRVGQAKPVRRALRLAASPPEPLAPQSPIGVGRRGGRHVRGIGAGQQPGAALLAVAFRVNLPVAVVVTLYTNPFTVVPLYLIAYEIGALIFASDGAALSHAPEIDWSRLGASMQAYFDWVLSLGKPLAVGLPVLAAGLAVAGYVFVQLAWRAQVILAWRRRRRRRAGSDSG